MKGINFLLLNQATMSEAVNFWLNQRKLKFDDEVKVLSVIKFDGEDEFRVTLEGVKKNEEKN